MDNLKDEFERVVNVKFDERQALVDYYERANEGIDKMIEALKKAKGEVLGKINSLKQGGSSPTVTVTERRIKSSKPAKTKPAVEPKKAKNRPFKPFTGEYSKDDTWANKIEFIIRKFGRPLKTAEIAEEIGEMENLDEKQLNNVKQRLGAIISANKGNRFKKAPDSKYEMND